MSDDAAEGEDGADPAGAGPGGDRAGRDGRRGDDKSGVGEKDGAGFRTADTVGIEEAEQAYQRGRRLFGSNTTLRAGQDVHVGDRITVLTGRAPTSGPGPVREEQLRDLRDHYVAVPRYDVLRDALQRRRLLILVGPPGSGCSTTALHLLDELTSGRVRRLASETEFRELDDEHIGTELGYLARPADPAQLTATEADRLADLCVRHDSYLVVIAPGDPTGRRSSGSYAQRCGTPAPTDVLLAHLGALVRSSDATDTTSRLSSLATSEGLWAAVGPRPGPGAVAHLARLLVAHARGDAGLDDVRLGCEQFVAETVAEWFAVLHDGSHGQRAEQARRQVAQRVALAVFDDQPRGFTADVGDDLADLWQLRTRSHGRPARPTVAAETDDVLFASIGAASVTDQVRFRGTWVSAHVVRFTDERVPRAVLEHVWRRETALRQVMSEWLHQLVGRGDRALEIAAGQVVGYLCSIDFTHTFSVLIEPNAGTARRAPGRAARAPDELEAGEDEDDGDEDRHLGRRRFAAAALDQAARDPALAEAVARLLKRWRRSGDVALRWTVAAALGLDLGLPAIDETLEELRILGTPQELADAAELDEDGWDLVFVAGSSIARLFSHGAEEPVVGVLQRWIAHERSSLRLLAIQTVLLLADQSRATVRTGGSAADADAHEDDPRSGWPVLLEAAHRDPRLAPSLASLLRDGIRSRQGGRIIETTLGRWMGKAQSDPELLAALEVFLRRLVVDPGDRNRLRYIVDRRRHDWAEPLRPEIAARLLDSTTGRARGVPA